MIDKISQVKADESSRSISPSKDGPKFFNFRKKVKVWEGGLHKGIEKIKLNKEMTLCAIAKSGGKKILIVDAITGETKLACHRGFHSAYVTKIDFSPDNRYLAVSSTRMSVHIYKLVDAEGTPIMRTGISSMDIKSTITIKPSELRARKMSASLIEERPFHIDCHGNGTIPSAVFSKPMIDQSCAFELVILGESGHSFRVG